MKKSIVFIVCIFQFISAFSQTKHAIIVAIADYPNNEIWTDLSSNNDVVLVKDMLKEQQFLENNITYLIDEDATPENLDKAFESLIGKLKEGDIVYFHYSGHGQQVADIQPKKRKDLVGRDEKDGKDEALVLYNAPQEFDKKGEYEMEHHYVDDQMKVQFDKIRKKIGAKGQVILVIDACHSGTSTRGANNRKVRGSRIVCAPVGWEKEEDLDTSAGFGTDFEYNMDQSLGKMVAFFGCKAEQENNEYRPEGSDKRYGSLTYFLIKGMKKLGENASYANLFSEIRKNMLVNWGGSQIPEIEGDDLNQAIFSNTFIPTEPFFNIESIYFNEVHIDAGTLSGLAVGDELGLFGNDVNNPKDTAACFKGKITEISALKATLKLTQGIEESKGNNGLYRVFLIKRGSTGAEIKVKLDLKKHKKEITSRLEMLSNLKLVKADFNYLVKELQGGKVIIYNDLEGVTPFKNMKPMTVFRAEQYDSLILFLKQASQIEMLRKLTCADPNIDYEVKFLNSSGKEVIEGITYQIEILNKGNEDFHMQIIDIEPDSKMSIVKNKDTRQPLSIMLRTGEKKIIPFRFTANPAGMEQFLFIATPDKIDLSPIEKLGEEIRTNDSKPRGNVSSSPFVEFINTNSSGERGASSDPGEVTIKTLIFELKSKQ